MKFSVNAMLYGYQLLKGKALINPLSEDIEKDYVNSHRSAK